MKALYQKIRFLKDKNYGLYKSLMGRKWDFGDFSLEFIHIQGDPYASPSRVLLTGNLKDLGFNEIWWSSFEHRLALSDFLLRKLCENIAEKYPEKGDILCLNPGPEVLIRNALWVENATIRICLQVKLPGEKRRIESEKAAEILTMVLPDLVSASVYYNASFERKLQAHFEVLETRRLILEKMREKKLVAFVPNGAIIPRASGLSLEPLKNGVVFEAPQELEVSFEIRGKKIVGMGIPQGITVITGGAFHGKSTLLQGLNAAVYPHIPGDGREGIVVDESAVRIKVEEGRVVQNTDISTLVRDLPGGISTKKFQTLSASGSTSEAANLMEALEIGSRTFFIDEDSSAVNFLIRDFRVRELLGIENEPLIPLSDRIQEFAKCGCSFILVAGACGDFLTLADNIIVMINYKAKCVKNKREELQNAKNLEPLKIPELRNLKDFSETLQAGIRPTSSVEKQIKIKLNGEGILQIGTLKSNIAPLFWVSSAQKTGAGIVLLHLLQKPFKKREELFEKIKTSGFREIFQGYSRDFEMPRKEEILQALFRLREEQN